MSGFRDVTGHERTIEHLKNAIASGRVSQAYLLVGDKGMGKKTIAQAFAQTAGRRRPTISRTSWSGGTRRKHRYQSMISGRL